MQGPHHRLELLHLAARAGHRRRRRRAGRRSRSCCSPSSSCRPLSARPWSSTNWCTGISSTAVTPSFVSARSTAGCAMPGVRAAQLLRHDRVVHRHALDVRLVDHRLVVRGARLAVVGPVEERVDHHRVRHCGRPSRRRCARPGCRTGSRTATRPSPRRRRDGLRVRVDQQLVRVAAQAAGRVVRAVHAVPVALAGADARQVAVVDEAVHLGRARTASRCPRRRTGTVRRTRRPRRTGRSSSRLRRRSRRAGRAFRARAALGSPRAFTGLFRARPRSRTRITAGVVRRGVPVTRATDAPLPAAPPRRAPPSR